MTACVGKDKILFVKTYFEKKDSRTRLCLCAAAEVLLTEQKKTGDSVVLFVATSITSQFHFTLAYFELFNSKQLKYINFLLKE